MKIKSLFIIIITVLLLNISLYGQAEWQQQIGPRGNAKILYADNSVLFAYIDSSRIYRSEDNGISWVESHNGIPSDVYVKDFIKANGVFFVSVGSFQSARGIYKSRDGGVNWVHTSLTLESDPTGLFYMDSVLFAKSNSSNGTPLWHSLDLGETWMASDSLSDVQAVGAMVEFYDKIIASTNKGAYVSSDAGMSWSKKMSTGLPLYSWFDKMYHVSGTPDSLVYGMTFGFSGVQIYATTDEGDNWELKQISGLPVNGEWIFSKPTHFGGELYAAAEKDAASEPSRIYKSGDYGLTWTLYGASPEYNIITFTSGGPIALNDSAVFVSTGAGIFKSVDNGNTWTEASEGIIYNSTIRSMASVGGKVFASWQYGILQTTTYPGEWQAVNNPDTSQFATKSYSLYAFQNYLFAQSYRGIFRSSDFGVTWDSVSNNIPANAYSISEMGVNDSKIYATVRDASDNILYYSTDSGETWTGNNFVGAYMSGLIVGNTAVYIKSDKIYYTEDDGVNWNELGENGLPTASMNKIIIESNGRVILFNFYTGDHGIFYTDDKGTTWTQAAGLPVDAAVNKFTAQGGKVFAATSKGVYVSFDNGETWETFSNGIGEKNVLQVISQGKYYLASVWVRGVWFIPAGNVVSDVKQINSKTPDNFKLSQNYPNPFNPSTVIQFSIPASLNTNVRTTLKIFDLTGAEIVTLLDESKSAGTYEVIFNAENLASGVYFYRINAGNYSAVKKLMLIK